MQKKKKGKKKVIYKPLKKVIKKVEIKTVEAPVHKSKLYRWLGMANAFLKKHKLISKLTNIYGETKTLPFSDSVGKFSKFSDSVGYGKRKTKSRVFLRRR